MAAGSSAFNFDNGLEISSKADIRLRHDSGVDISTGDRILATEEGEESRKGHSAEEKYYFIHRIKINEAQIRSNTKKELITEGIKTNRRVRFEK